MFVIIIIHLPCLSLFHSTASFTFQNPFQLQYTLILMNPREHIWSNSFPRNACDGPSRNWSRLGNKLEQTRRSLYHKTKQAKGDLKFGRVLCHTCICYFVSLFALCLARAKLEAQRVSVVNVQRDWI